MSIFEIAIRKKVLNFYYPTERKQALEDLLYWLQGEEKLRHYFINDFDCCIICDSTEEKKEILLYLFEEKFLSAK